VLFAEGCKVFEAPIEKKTRGMFPAQGMFLKNMKIVGAGSKTDFKNIPPKT
jgi:hypothetical protein